jgi:hypothetical protein
MEFWDFGTSIVDISTEGSNGGIVGVFVALVDGFEFANVGLEVLEMSFLVRETSFLVDRVPTQIAKLPIEGFDVSIQRCHRVGNGGFNRARQRGDQILLKRDDI